MLELLNHSMLVAGVFDVPLSDIKTQDNCLRFRFNGNKISLYLGLAKIYEDSSHYEMVVYYDLEGIRHKECIGTDTLLNLKLRCLAFVPDNSKD